MKWAFYLVLVMLVATAWWRFNDKGKEIGKLDREIEQVENAVDPEEQLGALVTRLDSLQADRTFTGILLTFLTAGLAGLVFVFHILPMLAHRATHAIYDSAEMIEQDVMHDARALVAQGDYHGAIEAFKGAAKAEPLNRLPWVEIAKIQKNNLENPEAAIDTIRYALESQEWEISDAAYFMFRLAELYDEVMGQRENAAAILKQVVENFPRTRHSANAKTRLHEWGFDEQQAAAPQAVVVEPPPPETVSYELPPVEDEGPDNRG